MRRDDDEMSFKKCHPEDFTGQSVTKSWGGSINEISDVNLGVWAMV